MALFAPDIAVSHYGIIHKLTQDDFNHILDLASQTSTLPTPDRFFNTWVIDWPSLVHKLKEAYAEQYREVSAQTQSNEKGKTALMQERGDYTELPKVLHDLMGTVLGAQEGSREIYEVVSRVKGLPGNACLMDMNGCIRHNDLYFYADGLR
ncbi:hypothetical protein BDQ17DRAFT_1545719 [Cyathus striatus]|nr:hypothetical protein BDQ17DRAFT_1545719 [Cyathus striatus]